MVKNLPAIQETHVRTLGQEDPLEKGMATYSSILSWRIPQRSLASCSPWGHKVPDTTEWLTHTHSLLQSPFLCCCCSITMSCLTLWPQGLCRPGSSVLHCLPDCFQIHVFCVSDANQLILCCPLLLLPSIFPNIRAFSNEPTLHIR